jgi:cytochrome P450
LARGASWSSATTTRGAFAALLEFLRLEMLRSYVSRIDDEVSRHLDERWAGRHAVTVMPLMKRLTFEIIS